LHRDIGGLGQGPGIVIAEQRPAEANRGIDLRLPEQPVGVTGMPQ